METDRCSLAGFIEADHDSCMRLFTDSRVRHYLGGPRSKESAQEIVSSWIHRKAPVARRWAVRLKSNEELIGIVSISVHYDGKSQEICFYRNGGIKVLLWSRYPPSCCMRLPNFVCRSLSQKLNRKTYDRYGFLRNLGFSLSSMWNDSMPCKPYTQ